MEKFFSKKGLPLPDFNEDSNSEKEDSTALLEEPVMEYFAWTEPFNVVPSSSVPLTLLAAGSVEAEVVDSEKMV